MSKKYQYLLGGFIGIGWVIVSFYLASLLVTSFNFPAKYGTIYFFLLCFGGLFLIILGISVFGKKLKKWLKQ